MSARYTWNENTRLGGRLRSGLENLRSSINDLKSVLGAVNQMTAAQVTAALAFADGVNAAGDATGTAAKAELVSDIGQLTTGAPGAAIQQMLDQFA